VECKPRGIDQKGRQPNEQETNTNISASAQLRKLPRTETEST
jgi:hypothetical protein